MSVPDLPGLYYRPLEERGTVRRRHRRWLVLFIPLAVAVLCAISPSTAMSPQRLSTSLARKGVFSDECSHAALQVNQTCREQVSRIDSSIDNALYIGTACALLCGAVIDFLDGHAAAFIFAFVWSVATGCAGLAPDNGVVWSSLAAVSSAASVGWFLSMLVHHLRVLFPDAGDYAVANAFFSTLMIVGSLATIPLQYYLDLGLASLLFLFAFYGGVVGMPVCIYLLCFPRRLLSRDIATNGAATVDNEEDSINNPSSPSPKEAAKAAATVWDDEESLATRSRANSEAPTPLYSSIDKHFQYNGDATRAGQTWSAVVRHDGSKSRERDDGVAAADDDEEEDSLGESRRRLASSHREALVLVLTAGSTSVRKRGAARVRVTCAEAWHVVKQPVFWASCLHSIAAVCSGHFFVSTFPKLMALAGADADDVSQAQSLAVYAVSATGILSVLPGLLVRRFSNQLGLLASLGLNIAALLAGAALCAFGLAHSTTWMLKLGLCLMLLFRNSGYALLNLTLPTLFANTHGVGSALGLAYTIGGSVTLALEPQLGTEALIGPTESTAAIAVVCAISAFGLVAEVVFAVAVYRHLGRRQ